MTVGRPDVNLCAVCVNEAFVYANDGRWWEDGGGGHEVGWVLSETRVGEERRKAQVCGGGRKEKGDSES